MGIFTRRGFLAGIQALAAWSVSSSGPSRAFASASKPETLAEDYYEKLGVEKIINAAGTYTFLTASTMPEPVRRAVDLAARHPVRLNDLQAAAGRYLANRLRCEAALVTAGTASALTLGTAACLTVANRSAAGNDIYRHIPAEMQELKNEVIVQKAHRYDYDHALLNCGIRFVEVETIAEYEAAFNANTVIAHFFNAAEGGSIGREDWIRIAHKHGVPCMNDAAADVPPVSNLWNYTQMGFDLVCFSGGKGMRGPQNAGLLLGKKELIEAAAQNNNPISDRVGRGMKVAKEQIVGMVAAVDWFLSQTDEAMESDFNRRAQTIADRLRDIPSLRSHIYVPEVANHVPHLLLHYDSERVKIAAVDVMKALRAGNPSIELNPATGTSQRAGIPSDENTIVVGVWMLQPGEEQIVAERLHQVLSEASRA